MLSLVNIEYIMTSTRPIGRTSGLGVYIYLILLARTSEMEGPIATSHQPSQRERGIVSHQCWSPLTCASTPTTRVYS